MSTVIAWLLAFMVAVAPTTRKQWYSEAKETPEQSLERYTSIASDIVSVVYDKDNPPLFSGPNGRARSAAVVMGVMLMESNFRRDVDYGLGSAGRGDGGRSWCLMQVKVDKDRTATWNKAKNRFQRWGDDPGDLVEGWTGHDLVTDRKKCITAGYRIIRTSFAVCGKLPLEDRLRAYTSGNCGNEGDGPQKSHSRMNTAINWYNAHAPSFTDAEILSVMPDSPTVASN